MLRFTIKPFNATYPLEDVTTQRLGEHEKQIKMIFEAIKQLIQVKDEPRRPIGFR